MFCRFYTGLILSLCLVVLSGCGSSPESKLIGTWEVDMSGVTAELSEKAGDNPAAQMMAQMAKTMSASNSITTEIRPDGKIITNISVFGQTRKEEGDWKYERMEGDEMVVSVTTSEKTTELVHFKFLPDGTLETRGKAMGGPSTTVKMKRVK